MLSYGIGCIGRARRLIAAMTREQRRDVALVQADESQKDGLHNDATDFLSPSTNSWKGVRAAARSALTAISTGLGISINASRQAARRRRLTRLRSTARDAFTASPNLEDPEVPVAELIFTPVARAETPARRSLRKSSARVSDSRTTTKEGLSGEPSAALVPTLLQDQAAGLRTHASTEAVLTAAATVVRLIRALTHLASSSSGPPHRAREIEARYSPGV